MSYRKKNAPSDMGAMQQTFLPLPMEYKNPGMIRTLSTSQLTSDLPYQRPVKQENVDNLIRKWNRRELQPIVVSFRDGKFNVVDGQTRITAMRQMAGGGEVIIPCIIHTGMTYEDEADMYARLDTDKTPLTPRQHTQALVEAGTDPEVMEVKRLVEDGGFIWALTKKTNEPYEISAVRALINAYRLLGGEDFARMLALVAGTWHGTPNSLKASILAGMALFVKTYGLELSDQTFIKSMADVGPDLILAQGRIDTNISLRFARIIWENYNTQQNGGPELPYRFKR